MATLPIIVRNGTIKTLKVNAYRKTGTKVAIFIFDIEQVLKTFAKTIDWLEA